MNNMESKTDRCLWTGFILFLVILLMLIIFSETGKGSDVSNWIIAGANIAMAAAAIKAWRAARKFLSEFFAQEGYRLAIEMINQNVIHLGSDNKFTQNAQAAFAVCSKLNGDWPTPAEKIQFRNAVTELERLQSNNMTLLSNMNSLSFRMETYGIHAAENKSEALNAMVIALDNMNQQGEKLLEHLREDVEICEVVGQKNSYLFESFNSKHLVSLQPLLEAINVEWNKMVLNRDSLLSGGKHARKLFVVRDH